MASYTVTARLALCFEKVPFRPGVSEGCIVSPGIWEGRVLDVVFVPGLCVVLFHLVYRGSVLLLCLLSCSGSLYGRLSGVLSGLVSGEEICEDKGKMFAVRG